jgi:Ca2+-binding EF-hand superfamily protein
MKTPTIPIWLALLATAATTATASPAKGRGNQEPPPPPPLLFKAIDKDRNKIISAEELQAASESLAKLDANGDGEITLKEALTPPAREEGDETEPAEGKNHSMPIRPAPPLIKALDTNGDGSLSPEEMEQAPETLKILDKNKDGTLSPEEMKPAGPPPAPPGGE